MEFTVNFYTVSGEGSDELKKISQPGEIGESHVFNS